MGTLKELQDWYKSQCNDDWEHSYGVKIDTLDNPGWSVTIDIADTDFEGVTFRQVEYGVGANGMASGENWLTCKVENGKFVGYGGPHKLEEILTIFLNWAKTNSEQFNQGDR